jgi:hypothetical protein
MLPFPEGLVPAFLTVVAANYLTAEGRWRFLSACLASPYPDSYRDSLPV